MRITLRAVLLMGFALAGIHGAYAGLEATPGPNGGADAGGKQGDSECNFRDTLAKFESGGTKGGGYQADNGRGYIGKYQMGHSALVDTGYKYKNGGWTGKNGIRSAADFKNNGAEQEKAQAAWEQKLDSYTSGLKGYIGSSIPGCGKPLTQEGLRAAAHLVGPGGAESFLKSGGKCGKAGAIGTKYNTTDGNGTCASKYMCAQSGCNSVEKDMSKKTCDVTMPMIEAIQCSNFPANLQSFCQQTQPHLMTRAECNAAESWAQRAPKGPQKESCEGQTFGPGTGSWSYVLACSYMSEAVADNDGVANKVTGPTQDPQCMQKLKAAGVEFKELGQVQNGSYGGTTCTIENAVSLRGTAIPYGANLTMTCDTAMAMENFSKSMRGLGVTGYYGIGSTRECGPKRDKRGNIAGTITEHARGMAVDVSGFYVGGRKISFGAIHGNSADGVLAKQAKSLACSAFNLVLSPTYAQYAGTFVHFHMEQSRMSGCK